MATKTFTNTTKPVDTEAALRAEIEALKAERAQLLAAKASKATITVGQSTKEDAKPSVVNMYGVNRFPVALHGEQWLRVIQSGYLVLDYIANHEIPMKEGNANISKAQVVDAARRTRDTMDEFLKQNS